MKKRRYKIVVNNKLRGDYGAMNPKTNKIEVNVRAHKGDKSELASTLKHEILHVKHPEMTEKEVYKRSAKTKISPDERVKLLSRLRGARVAKRTQAMRKKYKVDTSEPGDIYEKAKTMSKEQLAIRGLV